MTTRAPTITPRQPAPEPAEAATEVGLDLDGSGDLYYPAPIGTLPRPLYLAAVLVAAVAGIVFGPDLAVWASLWGGR